ncbi:hypothetical protein B296_00004921 [Ensete ventricosum]|uniref:Uncharacterized protein n=1 Tax=Ensete ventricosum TaxID=4639 RepID=A0A427B588_ENSVE|nr:hypothetical protein B296_00004921 [Ensete ventricosum]
MLGTESHWARLRARLEMLETKNPWARLRALLEMLETESPWARLSARLEILETKSSWTRLRARISTSDRQGCYATCFLVGRFFLGLMMICSPIKTLRKVTRGPRSISSGAKRHNKASRFLGR